jgi:glycosyltransferase involved in cell wall biosynthesis
MEAMSSGLPIVCTAAGGVPNLLENGKEGLIVQAGDVRGLSASMEYLLGDREARLSLGKAAELRAREQFDVSTMVEAYEGLYEELVDDPHPLEGKNVLRDRAVPADSR